MSPETATPWVGFLLALAAKGTVILLMASIATLLMRGASAANRHLVWTTAVLGVLLLPFASPLLPRFEVGVPFSVPSSVSTEPSNAYVGSRTAAPRAAEGLAAGGTPAIRPTVRSESSARGGTIRSGSGSGRNQAPAGGAGAVAAPSSRIVESSGSVDAAPSWVDAAPPRPGWSVILVAMWMGGVLFGLGRIATGIVRLRWLERTAAPLTTGPLFDRLNALSNRLDLRRSPRLLRGDDGTIPMTWGAHRSAIILPADAETWEPWRIDAVLTHELGHIVRRDYLAQMAAHVACALHWFNPLAWVAANRMRIEREHACDDLVVRQGHEASSYAHELVELARSLRATPAAATVGICFARPNRLRDRLLALMDETRDRRPLTRATALKVGGLAVILSLPLAALAAVPAETGAAPGTRPPTATTTAGMPTAAMDKARVTDQTDASATVGEDSSGPTSLELPGLASPRGSGRAGFDLTTVAELGFESPLAIGPAPTVIRASQQQQARVLCNPSDGESESHIHQSSNDVITISAEYGDCRSEVRVEGDLVFNEDFTAVTRVSNGGLLRFDVRRPGTRHRLEIERGPAGGPKYDWSVNGNGQPFDAAAERWLAEVLLDFFRSTSYKSAERAAWIIGQQGPEGLLAEVEQMWAGHAQARYLEVLLEDRSLSQGQVRRAIEVAAANIESDHALGEVLQTAAENHSFDAATRGEFIAAAATIESDHTHGQVLATALGRGDLTQENLEALLESAITGIESDHTMSEILIGLAERYALEPRLRAPFLRAAATLESDHNQGEVYQVVLGQDGLGSAELAAVLEASGTIQSDHTLSQLLISATAHDLGDATLRSAFLEAAGSIESDHSLGEVLSAAMSLEGLSDGDLASILSFAATIGSDHTLGNLLIEIADRRPSGPAVRSAYLEAARSIEGDHNLGLALESFIELDLEDRQLIATLEVARLIESDHSLSSLLIEVSRQYAIEGGVREAFLRTLDTIESEHSHNRVAAALLDRP